MSTQNELHVTAAAPDEHRINHVVPAFWTATRAFIHLAAGAETPGVTQATELIGAKDVQFAGYLAPELQVVRLYSGAVAAFAKAPDAARRFIQFLKSPAGVEAFRRAGWR